MHGHTAGEGNHWNAHPERIQCGAASVVGERVERYIDIAVGSQVFARGYRTREPQALFRDAVFGEPAPEIVLHGWLFQSVVLQQQTAFGNKMQNSGPELHHIASDLARAVK